VFRTERQRNREAKKKIIGAFGLVMVLSLFCAYPVAYKGSVSTITFTVTDKERVTYSNGEGTTSKYLIYTDGEVFENTDSFLFGKFNSSDVYGKLEKGKNYTATVAGWRIPFLSSYRNVISINATSR
jgi:hypothetical protein